MGKFDASGKPKAIPGHNLVLVSLGVFILWLGWFGFNPGSTMMADAVSIAKITVNTNASAAAGAILALFTAKLMFGKWEATMALNGALAGLVGNYAPCLWVTVPASIAIGAVAGVIVVLSVVYIEKLFKIDDPGGCCFRPRHLWRMGNVSRGIVRHRHRRCIALPGLFNGGGPSS